MSGLEPCRKLPGGLVIERVLGRGSFGIVVSAITPAPHRRVAVKLLSSNWAFDSEQRRRLLREAQAVRRLTSQHVARVLDIGSLDDGSPFLVLEHLRGRSLESIVKVELFTEADAIRYTLQALDALAEAHRIGLVHRDVKPGNLFLSEREGRAPKVKVLDFGLVKDIGGSTYASRLTLSGTSIGTPAYMPPEQFHEEDAVGPPADIWSIGITLFELLTGEVPFGAVSIPAMVGRILDEPAPSVRTWRPDVSKELDHVIAWCLEKNPAQRPENAEVLRDVLACLMP